MAWEEQKETERLELARKTGLEHGVLSGIAANLPSLMRSLKLQRRAARVGFDLPSGRDVILKINEELIELTIEFDSVAEGAADRRLDEVGDLLFSVVNLARHVEVDPDRALRHANGKFERRFRWLEQKLIEQGRSVQEASLKEMEELWQRAKTEAPDSPSR